MKYRDDIKVELIGQHGTDEDVARAAWVSSGKDQREEDDKRVKGVINALMRDLHSTPFESGYFAFRVEAPRAVRDEAVRHRNLSFSCSSLRYTEDSGEYYIPPHARPLAKTEDFKQIQPKYERLHPQRYAEYVAYLKKGYEHSEKMMQFMRDQGFDETEMTRWMTHDGTYVSFICRMSPRALMGFLSLRTHVPTSAHISYPMWEIEQMAVQMEGYFKDTMPLTYAAWNKHGRIAI